MPHGRVIATAPTLEDFLGMQPSDRLKLQMTRVSGFTQRSPSDGAPSTKPTDVYLGYDDEHFSVDRGVLNGGEPKDLLLEVYESA
jgi:hypothetical protein